MDVKIIYEDGDLLVIDKPSGVTVNRAETTRGQETIQEWVENYLKVSRVAQVPQVSQGERTSGTRDTLDPRDTFQDRAGIVHRLDKETSGILLIAKNAESFADLQRQFKERVVKKTYLALVHGAVTPEEGEIKVPVGRLPWNRERFGVLAGGREAVTGYKVLINYTLNALRLDRKGASSAFTLLELYPQTGRTHQIRVHLKYLGNTVVGDLLYGGRKTSRQDRLWCPRLFLHAKEITFCHPKSGKKISLVSNLPDDLQSILTKSS